MCGFVGVFDPNASVDFDRLDLLAAADEIRHRGPDMSSTSGCQFSKVIFNRLSINDLKESGLQPFQYQGVRAYINGEIYNHKELAKKYCRELERESTSDCEIIPYLYHKFGDDFITEINGMFAIILIDENNGEIKIFRDRYGVKPLFIQERGSALFFASEMKALTHLDESLSADFENVMLAFSSCDVVAPHTVFKQIQQIMPGHMLRYNRSGKALKRWYFPNISPPSEKVDVQKRFFDIFDSAIQLRLDCDVPVGAYLSGGLDSTLNCIRMHKQGYEGFNVFNATIEDKSTHEPDHDNINARKLAKDLGLNYHCININKEHYFNNLVKYASIHDEMLLNTGDYIFYAISEQAKNHVTVMMDGMGADELFAGYPWQAKIKKWNLSRTHSSLYQRGVFETLYKLNPSLARLYRYAFSPILSHASSIGTIENAKFAHYRGCESKQLSSYQFFMREIEERFAGDQHNYIDFYNYLNIVPNQCVKGDRGAMYSSIENRSPFLDYRLVDFMFSLPSKYKGVPGRKELQRTFMQDIAPDYILNSPKSGPTFPVDYWLKGDSKLYTKVLGFLSRNRQLFADVFGDVFSNNLNDSGSGGLTGIEIHALIAFKVWYQKNVEKSPFPVDITLPQLLDI